MSDQNPLTDLQAKLRADQNRRDELTIRARNLAADLAATRAERDAVVKRIGMAEEIIVVVTAAINAAKPKAPTETESTSKPAARARQKRTTS